MAQEQVHDGGCLCGNVRYRITGPFDSVAHCHCTMCRRASGAAVTTWVTVPVARFAVTAGEPTTFRSSDHGLRQFCPNCGAQIAFKTTQRPGEVDVTVGTLDHPERHAAEFHIFAADKISWLHVDEDLLAYPGFSSEGEGA